jgi:DNA polymerase-3 subunit delta'
MSWSQIIGHEDRVAAFRQIVARHRLAHAYLFVGPAGVGKRTFALELAKALLCEAPGKAPDALDACDQCDACRWVDAGTHPDLFQVQRPEDKNEMPMAVMAECCRNFSLKPARGRGKIGIIDDADDFNEESANCFLKTLEEPPPGSLFLLIGTSLDRQLPTIKSRCQMVRFAPLPDAQVRLILQKHGIDEANLDRLVRLSAGSPGQGVALEDESLWKFRREALQALAMPKMDSVALGKDFVKAAETVGKEASLQRRWANQALKLLIDGLIDAIRIQAGAPARSAESAELPWLTALAQKAQPDTIQALVERCLETETQLSRYVQLGLVLEALTDALGQMLEQTSPVPLRYQGFAT